MLTRRMSLGLLFIASRILFVADARADLLTDILKRGTVRVGVSLFTPWTIQHESGGLSGFEIDVANPDGV
jgi:polar amino acid transport system substrate-binding protein